MSDEMAATDECTLSIGSLCDRINKGRKMRSLPPVENSAIASRCNLRFNIGRESRVDFTQDSIILSESDIGALENLLNEQFDCMLEGDVSKLCSRQKESEPATVEAAPSQEEVSPQSYNEGFGKKDSDPGVVSRIKKIFGGK